MPSPAIPRSTSDTVLLSSSSSSKSKTHRRRPSSTRSSKSSYWLAWSNINKLGSLISIGRKSTDNNSHSDLTEENLEAHNRRQKDIIRVDDRNAKCSPYYKGLTDYSLVLSREKQLLPAQGSPGRESHATVVTTSSLSSFVLVKVQEWSSWFRSPSKSSTKDNLNNAPAIAPVPAPCLDPTPADATEAVEQGRSCDSCTPWEEKKDSDKNVLWVINEEKPLRERVSSQSKSSPPPPPPPPPPAAEQSERVEASTSNVVDEKNETIINMLEEKKFIWADKYRPKALKDFICNSATARKMQSLITGIDCKHFIFEGPAGVGKRTMIWAMIQEAYGPDKVQAREECKAFTLKGESIGSIKVRIKISSQHIEVDLSDLEGYEKHVIVQLIKETNNSKISKNGLQSTQDTCRAIVLYNADKLATDAVLYIKWLLERYKGSSKFFFCCSDVSKLQPIKELSTFVQLFLPSNDEVVKVLEFIAREEGIELPPQFAERIAKNSKNNLRQAIRSLEASWQKRYPFTENQVILTGWEDDIANIAKDIVQEQSPKQLYFIRGKLQNLIEHDVSPEFIFDTLVEELKKNLDELCQVQLDSLFKDYNRKEGNMLEGENQLHFPNSRHEKTGKRLQDPAKKKLQLFLNIEEFIAKFMSMYKLHLSTNI